MGAGQGECPHGQPVWQDAAARRVARLRKECMVSSGVTGVGAVLLSPAGRTEV